MEAELHARRFSQHEAAQTSGKWLHNYQRRSTTSCAAHAYPAVLWLRLPADLKTSVLLLEVGGKDETEVIANPNRWSLNSAAAAAAPRCHSQKRGIACSD